MAPHRTLQAYDNSKYLHSREGRIIRVLAEFSEPKHRFEKSGILDTVVFFGSARILSLKTARQNLKKLKQGSRISRDKLERAEMDVQMASYYEDAARLSRQVSRWGKSMAKTLAVCSGGGPGIMEAANKGAKLANFPSIGLNISLPFEQKPNPYITPELNFDFHYFFLRKFWFVYMAKALLVFPGGFGTLDEMMEVLTLVQTRKIDKNMLIILYGEDFWKQVINFEFLIKAGTIDRADLKIFKFCNTVEEAFKLTTAHLEKVLDKRKTAPDDAGYSGL